MHRKDSRLVDIDDMDERRITINGIEGRGQVNAFSVQLRVFLLTYVAYVSIYLGRKPLSVTKGAMGVPTSVLSHMDTAFLACYAFGQLFLSPLSSQLTAAKGLAICYIGCSLTLVGFVAMDSDLSRTVLWGAQGLFQAMCYPLCVRALTPHLQPASRGKLMGLWCTCQASGH